MPDRADGLIEFTRGEVPRRACVERVQRTIIEECWKPAFARHAIPTQTGLGDLVASIRMHGDPSQIPSNRPQQTI